MKEENIFLLQLNVNILTRNFYSDGKIHTFITDKDFKKFR